MTCHLFEITYTEKNNPHYGLYGFAVAKDPTEAKTVLFNAQSTSVCFERVSKVSVSDLETYPELFQRCFNFAVVRDDVGSDDLVVHLLGCRHSADLFSLMEDIVTCDMPQSFALLFEQIVSQDPQDLKDPYWLRKAVEWNNEEYVRAFIAHGATDPDGRSLTMACDDGMHNMFSLILPVSNPTQALNKVMHNQQWIEDHLNTMQHARISENLPPRHYSKVKKI